MLLIWRGKEKNMDPDAKPFWGEGLPIFFKPNSRCLNDSRGYAKVSELNEQTPWLDI